MDSQATPKEMIPSSPQPGFISLSQGPMETPAQLYKLKAPMKKFLRGEPKVLGTVQIMIALMNFTLGIILIFVPKDSYIHDSFLLHTGYIFWGSAFFIISGSLSIAAENRTTNTLIQSSLAMNIISSVVAGLGIIFFVINLINLLYFYCYEDVHDDCVYIYSLLRVINLFLLILTILEFILSLVVSGFGCRASCCVQGGVTILMPPPPYVAENPAAEACKGGAEALQKPAADTTALPGSILSV